VDLHERFSQVSVINEDGEELESTRFPNNREFLKTYFEHFPEGTKVAVESTSNLYWFAEVVERAGRGMQLSHPLKTK